MARRSILAQGLAGFSVVLVLHGVAAQQSPTAPPQKASAPAAPGSAAAKAPPEKASAPAASGPAAVTATGPAPIPLANVAAAAQAVAAEIRDAQSALDSDKTQHIRDAVPGLTEDVDARVDYTARLTRNAPTLTDLRHTRRGWEKTHDTLAGWQRELSAQSERLEKQTAHFEQLAERWAATLAAARAAPGTPPETLKRIEQTSSDIRVAHDAITARRAASLSLLDQVATQIGRSSQALDAIDGAAKQVVDQLLVRQSRPIWRPGAAAGEPTEEAPSLREDWAALTDYVVRAWESIAFHAVIVSVLAALLVHIRRRVHAWAAKVAVLSRTEPVFNLPVAAALLLSVFASRWIYPDAPRLFWSMVGAVALIATVTILRHIGDRRLVPLVYALAVTYVADQVRELHSADDLLPRLIFLSEMIGGAAFAHVFARRFGGDTAFGRWARVAGGAAFAIFVTAFIAHALGFTSLGELLGGNVLSSAYAAIIFYAAVLIVDALLLLALHARPLLYLRLVQSHADWVWSHARRVVSWIAVAWWALVVLDRLGLRERLFAAAGIVLRTGVKAGSLDISVGDVLGFGITLWLAVLVSRLVNFVLEEDVFPRHELPRGLPYAIATTIRYLILAVGFLAAVAVLGVDMTKFTILIGALTVGIGFGLQNIINNFVSGLILLFERPVKVGDVIQVGDTIGIVQRIGIRATVMNTPVGAHIIVPNGQFISANVTNLTGWSKFRPAQITVAVASGSDVRRVLEVLRRAAAGCEGVLETPPPQVLLSKLGPDPLLFDLRVWTHGTEDWARMINALVLAVSEALREANIAVK